MTALALAALALAYALHRRRRPRRLRGYAPMVRLRPLAPLANAEE